MAKETPYYHLFYFLVCTGIPDSITHAWMRVARHCGIRGVNLHAGTRHTHATLMLKQGIHPKIVQERLGHATISTTLDTYSHVTPWLQQAAAIRFDDIAITGSKKEEIPTVR
jgi:integrase